MSAPPPNPDGRLEAERFSLERERLRLERQKLAIEVRLKRRDLTERRNKSWKELFANPLALVIVGGFITLMTTIITTSYTANENRNAAKQALQAELIKKFVEAPKSDTVRENLTFLVNAGLLPDYGQGIAKYLKDNPDAAPTVGNAVVGFPDERFEAQAPDLMRKLMSDFGFKDFQAAGIVGNIGFETAGFRILQEPHPVSGRGGFGYLQWTGAKRDSFEKFSKEKGLDPGSAEANYGFLKRELETVDGSAVAAVKAAATIEEATRAFQDKAVRSGWSAYPARVRYALRALDIFKRS